MYKVLWHSRVKKDVSAIPPHLVDKMAKLVQSRLAQFPEVVGEPLKGTSNALWKLRFSDYRILYSMNRQTKEVWILAIRHRRHVYQESHVHELVKIALVLQKTSRQ